jgi:hypothetical protein
MLITERKESLCYCEFCERFLSEAKYLELDKRCYCGRFLAKPEDIDVSDYICASSTCNNNRLLHGTVFRYGSCYCNECGEGIDEAEREREYYDDPEDDYDYNTYMEEYN